MVSGYVRDGLPRITLRLPGRDGGRFEVEFVMDTGFEGDLSLPQSLTERLLVGPFATRLMALADQTLRPLSYATLELQWLNEPRETEILVMEGNPLLGMYMINGATLYVEGQEGGDVSIEEM